MPFEAEMVVPPNKDLKRVCATAEFAAIVERLKRECQLSVVPDIKLPANASPTTTPGECSFRFTCQRSNSEYLVTAREMLEQFLISHNIRVYPTTRTHKRADSFAEAFPHFESKLLATAHSGMLACCASKYVIHHMRF